MVTFARIDWLPIKRSVLKNNFSVINDILSVSWKKEKNYQLL